MPLVSHCQTTQICEWYTYTDTWRSENFSKMQKSQMRRRLVGRQPGRENERRGGTRSWIQWLNHGSSYLGPSMQTSTTDDMLAAAHHAGNPPTARCITAVCSKLPATEPDIPFLVWSESDDDDDLYAIGAEDEMLIASGLILE